MLQLLLQNNLAVYSCHLPLDAHPVLGNNAQLATQLGFKKLKPFFFEKGNSLGFKTNTIIRRAELARKLELALTHPAILLPGGPEICRRIGIVSGSAGAQLKQALDEGVDTLITGEGPHWTHAIHLFLEAGASQQFAEDDSGIVVTKSLVKIAGQ